MKYYCIGIKGSGMSTLAQILYDLGNEVSGYDDAKGWKYTEDGLNERGIKIYYGHDHEIDKDTIVTFSRAFKDDHPEMIRVRELGLRIDSYNEVVGDLTSKFNTISVCGTHGKTTTSLLLSTVLNNTVGCNYFVGDGTGHADKKNNLFVIESDEFNRHFLAYHPTDVILTNIELDHTECYKDINDLIKTFNEFVNKATGIVVLCGDDANVRKLKVNNKNILYYGFNEDNDLVAKNVSYDSEGVHYDAYLKGELLGHFDLPLYGSHMVLNSLGAIGILRHHNIDVKDIEKYFKTFVGAKRRFKEYVYGDTVVIDDYAHHPTEIKVTLEAARQKYPNKKIVGVFLPNTYSRTRDLFDSFVECLKVADKAYVMEIRCDRERQEDFPGVTSKKLVEQIPNSVLLDIDKPEDLLVEKGSVLCFMSCADIYKIEDKYKELLEKGK